MTAAALERDPAGTPPDDHGPWIFTFGMAHRLVVTSATHHQLGQLTGVGVPLSRRYVRMPGTREEARGEMMRLFGLHWACQYPDEESAGVTRHGLTELVLTP